MGWKIGEVLPAIKQNVVDLISEDELIDKLRRKDEIVVKYGADPSRPDLHLGHYVCLKKLRDLQDIGFKIIFIVGDFTAMIGDPTGRSKTRPRLTEEEIKENAKTYFQQVFKVLDGEKTIVRYNSEWLSKLTAKDIIEIASTYTVARMLERDDFAKRYRDNIPISIHEFLYPLFQGYDSYATGADIEVGGTDQVFNFLVARDIQKHFGQESQVILTVPLLEGTDGRLKMSKSYDNYIGLTEDPENIYGKVMSIPDTLIKKYYKLVLYYTEDELLKVEEYIKKDPRGAKAKLAYEIVKLLYSDKEAKEAEEHFNRVFREKKIPENIPEFSIPAEGKNIIEIIFEAGLVNSKSEARRLIAQKAVRVNGEVVTNIEAVLKPDNEKIIKVGKRKFLKIVHK